MARAGRQGRRTEHHTTDCAGRHPFYILVTNIPSTGKPESGTFAKLDAALQGHGERLGIGMTCMWRETIDAMVDRAPDSIKWAYADMLAG